MMGKTLRVRAHDSKGAFFFYHSCICRRPYMLEATCLVGNYNSKITCYEDNML